MNDKRYKYIFGPVPSRRLGRSLGVDLVPLKVCPFDCIYCQVGRTTRKTTRRGPYVPAEDVLAELAERINAGLECDYITLSGSGEPTLHSELGRIIETVKQMTDIPVAVLTNGACLSDPQVRRELSAADVVLPSLDAGDAETFEKINRPDPQVSFPALVEGLKAFRREYAGQIHLEVFLVAGVNDGEQHVRKIRAIADEIGPDRIDVNTVARPPAEEGVGAVGPERLRQLCDILGPKARIIAPLGAEEATGQVGREDLLAMLRRRPCTVEDCARGLSCHHGEVAKLLEHLAREGAVVTRRQGEAVYYQAGDCQQP